MADVTALGMGVNLRDTQGQEIGVVGNPLVVDSGAASLPDGIATEAKQDVGNASLASIDSKTPALPATAGKQDTGNTSLASIDGKIPASPAAEHTTAGSPHAARLTDGSAFYQALVEATFTGRVGEVQSSPTANTVLARLKDLLTGIVLAAGSNTVGKVIDEIENEYVQVNGSRLQVKWAEISATASGDTTVVTGVSNKKIRVVAIDFVCSAAVSVSWKSASTVIRNTQAFPQYGGLAQVYPIGRFMETASGEALVVTLSATATVRGSVCYVEV